MPKLTLRRKRTLVGALTAYDSANVEFVIPEDLSALSDADLTSLHSEAVGHFDTLFNGGAGLTEADVSALSILTEGIESLASELAVRAAAESQRAALAAELATRVHTEERSETIEDVQDDNGPEDEEDEDAAPEESGEGGDGDGGGEPTAVVASSRREIRVNMASLRRTAPGLPAQRVAAPTTMRDLVYAAGDGTGYAAGVGVDWDDIGRIVNRRLAGFNEAQFDAAARAGRQISQQFSVATLHRPFPADLMITSNDPAHVEEVLARATDETRLQGGSLVASGGWCAPSEILYDFLELESRDGLFSLPEVNVTRGGIQWTTGIDYSTIYSATGFAYTEAQDISGTYAVDGTDLHDGTGGAGSKPVYKVPCPSFQEARLRLAGLALSAGLLQQRGYPEVIARTVRGALVAHDHKMSVRKINALVTGSTAVTMTTGTVGTAAPLLTAIELQVEHYRYAQRLLRSTTLEAVFPYWVHGAVRSDLALRQGLTPGEAFLITDAQINSWFSSRGIAPQFVYDWQPLTGAAGTFTQWPTTVQFLLYVAGTWVGGASDVITLDTIYDSTLLGANNYTALFTEEGWLVAKRGIDSRVITVPINPNGGTGAPVILSGDGSGAVAGGDVTGPMAGTSASSAITATGFTLTVTGASDAGQGLHGLPYRFSTDGGTTWGAWQVSNVSVQTGKTTATAYQTRHQVRDINGNISTGNALQVTTA